MSDPVELPHDRPLAEWSDEQLGLGIKQAYMAGAPVAALKYVRERHRRLGLTDYQG